MRGRGAAPKQLTAMDAHLVEGTSKAYLTEIRNRLDKAAGIGRAADACAGAGFHEKGLEVALDVEQLLSEATTLLNAASLINRISLYAPSKKLKNCALCGDDAGIGAFVFVGHFAFA